MKNNKTEDNRIKKLNDEQRIKEDKCDHYFLPSGGKWSPQSQKRCIFCNKTIS